MNDVIDRLADQAFQTGATDLFLCEDKVPRVRLNNDVQVPGDDPLTRDTLTQFWISCGADPETTQEKDISYITGGGHRLRVNLYKSLGVSPPCFAPSKITFPRWKSSALRRTCSPGGSPNKQAWC